MQLTKEENLCQSAVTTVDFELLQPKKNGMVSIADLFKHQPAKPAEKAKENYSLQPRKKLVFDEQNLKHLEQVAAELRKNRKERVEDPKTPHNELDEEREEQDWS